MHHRRKLIDDGRSRQARPATTTGHIELGSDPSELAKQPSIEDVERLGVDRLDHQPGHLPERIDVIALVGHGDVVAREQSTSVDHAVGPAGLPGRRRRD